MAVSRYRGNSRSRYFRSYTEFFIKAARLAYQLGRGQRFDLAIACSMPDVAILSTLPCKLSGTKLILDVHDTMPELYRDKFSGRRGAMGARLLMLEERLSAALADRVLAVHDLHAERLAQAGIRADKIRVVTNLPDSNIFKLTPRETSATRPFTTVCHGTVAKRLGLDVAVNAINILRNEALDIHLRVIGAGDYMLEVQNLVQALRLESYVSFEGVVPLEALPPILKQASVGLVPNLASGATHLMLPVKLLEYATLGIPVIAARLRTIEHYFDDAVSFFEPGDPADLARAIKQIHRHPMLGEQLVQRAATISTKLSQRQRQDYCDAIDSLFGAEELKLCNQANR
jgi:glycosyltransferase involved in cell wall biosynthesis